MWEAEVMKGKGCCCWRKKRCLIDPMLVLILLLGSVWTATNSIFLWIGLCGLDFSKNERYEWEELCVIFHSKRKKKNKLQWQGLEQFAGSIQSWPHFNRWRNWGKMSCERSPSSNLSNYSPFSLSFLRCSARITLIPCFWSGCETESPHWNEGARGLHGARVRREGSDRPWDERTGSAASSTAPRVWLLLLRQLWSCTAEQLWVKLWRELPEAMSGASAVLSCL